MKGRSQVGYAGCGRGGIFEPHGAAVNRPGAEAEPANVGAGAGGGDNRPAIRRPQDTDPA